ncbi:hypothetical protein J1614_005631 [Plenodomus biglobosus]|nr:hypothetical protein J1614_005631 [Plenodomus biglobosus]
MTLSHLKVKSQFNKTLDLKHTATFSPGRQAAQRPYCQIHSSNSAITNPVKNVLWVSRLRGVWSVPEQTLDGNPSRTVTWKASAVSLPCGRHSKTIATFHSTVNTDTSILDSHSFFQETPSKSNAKMKLTTLTLGLFALGAVSQKVGPNGKRTCAAGGISCRYQKGRCANLCGDPIPGGRPLAINPNCSCPEGQADNLYLGAGCIDFIRALGRASC